jgi:hypothetical protein
MLLGLELPNFKILKFQTSLFKESHCSFQISSSHSKLIIFQVSLEYQIKSIHH